jgi:hypothetical protein
MSTDTVRYRVQQVARALELANNQRATTGEIRLAWGFVLHAGSYSFNGEARPCWAFTTQTGESMALLPEMLPKLEHTPCWLMGAHPVALELSPAQSPDRPVDALIMTHMVAPDRRQHATMHSDVRSVVYPESTIDGLIFLTVWRPAFLPI